MRLCWLRSEALWFWWKRNVWSSVNDSTRKRIEKPKLLNKLATPSVTPGNAMSMSISWRYNFLCFFSLACELWHMHPHLNMHSCHIYDSPPQSVVAMHWHFDFARNVRVSPLSALCCFVADCVQLAAIWLKCLHFSLSKVIKWRHVFVYAYLVRWGEVRCPSFRRSASVCFCQWKYFHLSPYESQHALRLYCEAFWNFERKINIDNKCADDKYSCYR